MTTSVADTALLLTLEFPPDEDVRARIQKLVQGELSGKLLVPTIVLTEFLKVAGSRMGVKSASARIEALKSRGAKVIPIDEQLAIVAGKLLLGHPTLPIADALIASIVSAKRAEYVVTNDPHFKNIGIRTKWL